MRAQILRIIGMVVIATTLGACGLNDRGSEEVVGSLVGAGLGGWAGSNVGSGAGKLAATAAGALAGASVGGEVGRDLDKINKAADDRNMPVYSTGAQPRQERRRASASRAEPESLENCWTPECLRQRSLTIPKEANSEEWNCPQFAGDRFRDRLEGGRYYRDYRFVSERESWTKCLNLPRRSDGLRDGGRGSLRRNMKSLLHTPTPNWW